MLAIFYVRALTQSALYAVYKNLQFVTKALLDFYKIFSRGSNHGKSLLSTQPIQVLHEKAVKTREFSSSELSCPRDTKNLLSSYGLSNLRIGASWNCDRRLLRGGATAYWGWRGGGGGVGQLRSLLAA